MPKRYVRFSDELATALGEPTGLLQSPVPETLQAEERSTHLLLMGLSSHYTAKSALKAEDSPPPHIHDPQWLPENLLKRTD